MSLAKKNVSEFNADVQENGGYLYTTNAGLSSVLANKRITDAVNARIPACNTLVDIGCGDGTYTNDIKAAFPHLQIEGFDPAREAIVSAQKKYPEIAFKEINILDKNLTQLTQPFDVGVVRCILHHLSDQEFAIRNSLSIAKTLIIVEPNGNNPILKIIEKVSPYHRTHEEQSFTSWQLKEWCRRAGGKVESQEYIGFIPFFFPTFLTKVIYFFQPFLEKVPLIREFFSAQIVLVVKKESQ